MVTFGIELFASVNMTWDTGGRVFNVVEFCPQAKQN